VLDGHEGRADAHDHPLRVREELVCELLALALHGHLDPHLVDRTRVEPALPKLLEQPVAVGNPSRLDLNGVAHYPCIIPLFNRGDSVETRYRARVSRYRWLVLAAGTAAQTSFSAVLIGLPVLAPEVRNEYDLSLFGVGLALDAFWVGTFLTLLPWGLLADRVGERLRERGPQVSSQDVGLEVLAGLKGVDEVAYLRFASVYKDFQQVADFEREVSALTAKSEPIPDRDR